MPHGRDSGLQTLLVGIDGANVPVLRRLADDGAVPTLADLLETGYADDLVSQLPPWTPSAWPSMYTGVNPGKHGVYGFLTFDGYDWSVVDRTDVREFALWELLDHEGLTSVVVNVPVTHPPRDIDGAVVPGYVGPETPTCVPADALDSVPAGTDYRIYPPTGDDVSREDQLAAATDLVRSRGRLFRQLASTHRPDFGFVQFQQTDTVFHERPGDWDAAARVYGAVDEELAALLSAFDPHNVVVVSDHGIGEYTGTEFRVNTFLERQGLLQMTRDGTGVPSWDAVAPDGDRTDRDDPGDGLLTSLSETAAGVGLTSQRIERLLTRVGLAEAVADLAPTSVVKAAAETVDHANSRAYMRSRIELGVRLNLAGREPEGVVPRAEYEAVRERLMTSFRAVRTPDGEPLFDAVLPREDVFEGPHLAAAPDVVLVPADFDHMLSATPRSDVFGPPREPYNHKRAGLLVATGRDIDESQPRDGANPHLFDVAPTVLATLGVAPTERMDGTTLPFVDRPTPEPVSYRAFEPQDVGTTTDEAVQDHLANLGYLEDT